jgi:hypothetical protein
MLKELLGNINYQDNCGNLEMGGRIFQGLRQVITIYTGGKPLYHDGIASDDL